MQFMNNLSSGFGLIDEKMYHSHLEKMSLFLLTTTKQKLTAINEFLRLADFIHR